MAWKTTPGGIHRGAWTPNTFYRAGDTVRAPDQSLQEAKADFTSGASFNAASWSPLSAESGVFDVRAHGAKGDGTTDDTAAVQAAYNAVPNAGGEVRFPPGDYYCPGGITVPNRTTTRGAGSIDGYAFNAITRVVTDSATADCFTVNAHGCSFFDIAVVNTSVSAPTAGAGIHVTNGNMTRLRNVAVAKFYDNVAVDTGWWGKITDSFFTDPVRYNVRLRNTAYADDGDWVVHGCDFAFIATARQASAHFRFESGGAIRFTGNKLNGNAKPNGAYPGSGSVDVGLDYAIVDGGSTSGLVISGNSMEVARTAVVRITQAGPTYSGSLSQAMITGNNITMAPVGVWVGSSSSDATAIGHVTITGNVFAYISANAIYAQYMQSLVIGPNDHLSFNSTSDLIHLGQTTPAVSGARQVQVAKQNILEDSKYLLWNPITLDSSNHYVAGQARWEFEREIPTTTSSVTYSTLYQFTIPQNFGGIMEVVLSGAVVGRGAFTQRLRRSYTRGSGVVTVATVDTDVTAGVVMDVLFDTATSGRVDLKVRVNATAGGTDIVGVVGVRVDGQLQSVRKGP